MKKVLFPLLIWAMLVTGIPGLWLHSPDLCSEPQLYSADSSIAYASSDQNDLQSYLRLAHKVDPYALITGWFWDWRSVSQYRSNPGYHFGYDIAMPAGTQVPAGWTGQVTSIANWAYGEWGISIVTRDGYTITYGHLAPRVSEGSFVNVGDIVGTVAVNHVDIKIKDPQGSFVDFGKTNGLLAVSSDAIVRTTSSYFSMTRLDGKATLQAKVREITHLREAIAILKDYLAMEMDAYEESKDQLSRMEQLLAEELVSRSNLEEEADKVKRSREKTEGLQKRLISEKTRLALLEREASQYGWKGPDTKAEKKKNEKKVAEASGPSVDDARKKMELYEKLYVEGAVSRKELEEARVSYKRAQLETVLKEKK